MPTKRHIIRIVCLVLTVLLILYLRQHNHEQLTNDYWQDEITKCEIDIKLRIWVDGKLIPEGEIFPTGLVTLETFVPNESLYEKLTYEFKVNNDFYHNAQSSKMNYTFRSGMVYDIAATVMSYSPRCLLWYCHGLAFSTGVTMNEAGNIPTTTEDNLEIDQELTKLKKHPIWFPEIPTGQIEWIVVAFFVCSPAVALFTFYLLLGKSQFQTFLYQFRYIGINSSANEQQTVFVNTRNSLYSSTEAIHILPHSTNGDDNVSQSPVV